MKRLQLYDKNLNHIGAVATASDVVRRRRINSDNEITFTVPMSSDDFKYIEPKGHIKDERGQYYVINDRSRKRDGKSRMVQFDCMHIMFKLTDFKFPYASYIDEAYGVNIATLLNSISAATGGKFTFSVDDTFDLKDVKDFGRGNCLEALNKVIELYGCEINPDNFVIHIKKQIGMNRGYQARIRKNLMNITYKDASRALVTRMFSQMKDGRTFIGLPASNLTAEEYALLNAVPGAIVGGIIKVNYLISPYAGYWSNTTNTYYDGEIIKPDIEDPLEILKATRAALREQEVPALDIDLSAADIHRIDRTEPIVDLGDTIRIFDSEMQINDISARVMELREPLFDPEKQPDFTLANYYLRDYHDIIADLDKSKQIVERIISGGKVATSAFENFAAQAVRDINNSKTEVAYDERGIILRSKLIPNDIVVASSKGIYVSNDNGVTAEAAITAEGIMAPKVVGKLGNFVEIEIGVGNNVFKANQAGIHSGHQNFASSPFSVDMAGHMKAVGGDFSGSISASYISGGTIVGPYITSSLSYPRTEMSNTLHMFRASKDASNYLEIDADFSGAPGIVSYVGGKHVGRYFSYQSAGRYYAQVASSDFLELQGPNGISMITLPGSLVKFNDWNQIYNTTASQSLQSALNGKVSTGGLQDIKIQWFSNYLEIFVDGVYRGKINLV